MSDPSESTPRPDTLNDIGVLKRREIEARIVGPLLERLGAEFGSDEVHRIAREVVVDVARRQGAEMADAVGGNDLSVLAGTMGNWTKGDALEIEVLEHTDSVYAFNVTRCRYAEMYKELGIAELGAVLSCDRDGSLIEGFNGDVGFERTQTIMGGASHCDFRYTLGDSTDD